MEELFTIQVLDSVNYTYSKLWACILINVWTPVQQ